MNLLLAPHADDETLFAAYTCLRVRPLVVVCTNAGQDRWLEAQGAIRDELGCEVELLEFAEGELTVTELASELRFAFPLADTVYAPAYHPAGHEEHNVVHLAAVAQYGRERVRGYHTYAPRGHRTREGREVHPEPWMVAHKLAALACYVSQIENPATRPWFFDLLDLREWVA